MNSYHNPRKKKEAQSQKVINKHIAVSQVITSIAAWPKEKIFSGLA